MAKNLPDIIVKAIPLIVFLAIIIVIILLMLIYNLKKVTNNIKKVSFHLQLNDKKSLKYIINKMDEFAESNFHVDRKQFILSAIISFGVWIVLYSVIYIVVIAMDINIGFEAFPVSYTHLTLPTIYSV